MASISTIKNQQKGFTLVELVVTISVICILAVIGYVAYGGLKKRAHEAMLRSDLTASADILNVDRARSGSGVFPVDKDDADKGSGLPASSGTSYQYTVNNASSPPTFCLTATNAAVSMYITESVPPRAGACAGHTG